MIAFRTLYALRPIALLAGFPLILPAQMAEEAHSMDDAAPLVSERELVELVEDSSIGEAMDRRPDLNFNNVTIDGEPTNLSLDDIPADQIEAANVSKANTPDLDADLRGGGLNLRSKPTYSFEQRVLKGSIETRYYEVSDSFLTDLDLSYGKSMGRWGFIANASRTEGRRAEEEYAQDWEQLSGTGPQWILSEQQIQYREVSILRNSINATVDFKLTDQIRLYLKGDYRVMDRDHYFPQLTVRYDAGTYRELSETGAEVDGARLERSLVGFDAESYGYTLTTGGYLDFEAISIDYTLAYNAWNYLEPDWMEILFFQEDIGLSYDLTREDGPSFQTLPGSDADLNDPARFHNDWILVERWETDNKDWVASLNLKCPLEMPRLKGHLKAGFKLRGLEFFQDADASVYDSYDGVFTLADVASDYRNPDMLDGLYDHGIFPSTGHSLRFLESNRDRFNLNETRSREASDLSSYTVDREIQAAYAMAFLNFNALRIIAGARVEATDRSYTANELILDEAGNYVSTRPLRDGYRYTNWFPSIHASWALGRFKLIGSWSNTIERPDYDQIVPFRTIEPEDQFINAGNPDLQATLYSNFDLSIDYQLGGGNLLSLELFYQEVEDIVYYEVSRIPDGIYQGYEFGTYRNGPSGDIQGLRLIWNQSLGDWWSVADGFFLNAKLIYQESETRFPGRSESVLPMPERPRTEWEVTLVYEKSKLFLQLDIQFRESNLKRINDSDPWRDIYEGGQTVLNFSSSYEFADGIRCFLNVDNLTSEADDLETFSDGRLLSEYEVFPRRFSFGLRFDI
jgi:TonB-dependent receptor